MHTVPPVSRNLFHRVETAFPVTSPGLREHIEEILDWYRRDTTKAEVMQPDGTYKLRSTEGLPFDTQAEFVADAQRRRKRKVAVPVV